MANVTVPDETMSRCVLETSVKTALFVVDAVAVLTNVVHMIAVKPPKKAANASDVLQWAKTTVAMMALVVVVPLHATAFSEEENWSSSGKVAAVLLQQFLVDFYPMGLLTLAVTRLRVCLCKGNADVLITKMSALLTLGLCLLPLSISVILNAFISLSNIADSVSSCFVHYSSNMTRTPGQNLQSWFNLFIIIAFDILPILLTFVLYSVIQKTYRKSQNNLQRRRTHCSIQQRRMTIVQHSRKGGRSITWSLCLSAFPIFVAWTPYVALRLTSWLETSMNPDVHHAMTLFCIVFLYLLSPVGEGLFLSQKRENVSEIFKLAYAAIQARFRVEPLPRSGNGFANNDFIAEQIGHKSGQPSHPDEAQTQIFLLENDRELIQTTESQHNPTCSTEWMWQQQDSCIGKDGQTVIRGSPENTAPAAAKRRKVCFSTDVDEEESHLVTNEDQGQRRKVSRRTLSASRRLSVERKVSKTSLVNTPPYSPCTFSIPTDHCDDIVSSCCCQENHMVRLNSHTFQRRKVHLTRLRICESENNLQCYFSDCECKRCSPQYCCHLHRSSHRMNRSPLCHRNMSVCNETSPTLYRAAGKGRTTNLSRADNRQGHSPEVLANPKYSSTETVFGDIPVSRVDLRIQGSQGEARHDKRSLTENITGTYSEQLPASEIHSPGKFKRKMRRSASVCAPIQEPHLRREILQLGYHRHPMLSAPSQLTPSVLN